MAREINRVQIESVVRSCKILEQRLRDWSFRYKEDSQNHRMVMRLVGDIVLISEELESALRSGDRPGVRDSVRWLKSKAAALVALAVVEGFASGAAEVVTDDLLDPPVGVVSAAEEVSTSCEDALVALTQVTVDLAATGRAVLNATAGLTAEAQVAEATGTALDATVITVEGDAREVHDMTTAKDGVTAVLANDQGEAVQVVQVGTAEEEDVALPISPRPQESPD